MESPSCDKYAALNALSISDQIVVTAISLSSSSLLTYWDNYISQCSFIMPSYDLRGLFCH
jgi:hypothetical protein